MSRGEVFGGATVALAGSVAIAIGLVAMAIAPAAHAASSRAEYIAQVDPICSNTLDKEFKTFHLVGNDLKHGRFKSAGRRYAHTTRVFSTGVEQVAAVSPPAADAAPIGQWVGMLRAQVPLASRVTRLLKKVAGPKQINRAIKRLFNLSDRTQALVADYGFSQCQQL